MATFRTQLNQNQDGNILLSLPIFNIPLKTNINEYNNNNVIEHSKKGFINTSFDHGESSGRGHSTGHRAACSHNQCMGSNMRKVSLDIVL